MQHNSIGNCYAGCKKRASQKRNQIKVPTFIVNQWKAYIRNEHVQADLYLSLVLILVPFRAVS